MPHRTLFRSFKKRIRSDRLKLRIKEVDEPLLVSTLKARP